MKTISYRDNNITPKVGDRVVFSSDWITYKDNKEPFNSGDIFTIQEIEEQRSHEYIDGINYVCKVSMENIDRKYSFGWLEKVIEETEVVEKKKKEKKEFTTIEQDLMRILIGPE